MAKKTKSYSQVLATEQLEQLTAYHPKLFNTSWQLSKNVSLTLCILNHDAVYQNIVASVGKLYVTEGNSLTEQIRVDEERTRLMRQIESLERQIRSTSQPRRQREIYSEIKK